MAIIGDVLHSRVARSNIIAFNHMGVRVALRSPTLIPKMPEALGNLHKGSARCCKGCRYHLPCEDPAREADPGHVPSLDEYHQFSALRKASRKHLPMPCDAPWPNKQASRGRERGGRWTSEHDPGPGPQRGGAKDGPPLRLPRRCETVKILLCDAVLFDGMGILGGRKRPRRRRRRYHRQSVKSADRRLRHHKRS